MKNNRTRIESKKVAQKMLDKGLVEADGIVEQRNFEISEKGLEALKRAANGGEMSMSLPEYTDNSERPDPEKLAVELFKIMRIEKIEKLAALLLTHEMIEDPPELVEEYGKIIGIREKKGNGEWDVTNSQAWQIVQEEYLNTTMHRQEKNRIREALKE